MIFHVNNFGAKEFDFEPREELNIFGRTKSQPLGLRTSVGRLLLFKNNHGLGYLNYYFLRPHTHYQYNYLKKWFPCRLSIFLGNNHGLCISLGYQMIG